MPEHLRRCLILGIVVVLLASACAGDGDPEAGEGGGPGSAATSASGGDGDGSGSAATSASGGDGDGSGSAATSTSGGAGGRSGNAPTLVSVASASGSGGSGQGTLLTVRLSEGDAIGGPGSPAVSRVDGRPLDEAEVRAVTDRLPPWDYDDDRDTADFNRPAETLPPPRTGETIDRPFPAGPDIDAPDVDPGPLAVLRVQPEGDVGIAPFVSITFDQPMVPLATIGQLDELDVPATITPSLPGRWQWIGTRTLRFEHDPEIFDRLPMATSYVVEIPARARRHRPAASWPRPSASSSRLPRASNGVARPPARLTRSPTGLRRRLRPADRTRRRARGHHALSRRRPASDPPRHRGRDRRRRVKSAPCAGTHSMAPGSPSGRCRRSSPTR